MRFILQSNPGLRSLHQPPARSMPANGFSKPHAPRSTASTNLSELCDHPSGTISITTAEHAAQTVLWPVVDRFLTDYSDVHIELNADSTLTDIVAERFDAGAHLGE
jgi:hypothetical protein